MNGNKRSNDRQNMQFLINPFLHIMLLRITHRLLPLVLKLLLDEDPQVKLNIISKLDVVIQGNNKKKPLTTYKI